MKLTNSQAGTWRVHDSIFHGTAVSQSGPITHDYNGYITNAAGQWLTNGGSHDVFTNSLTWFTHALGRFYQFPLTFVNKGSMSANYPGLYHYTVIGNVKETNSVVDLGYHYIAVDFQNQPFDSDGDGTPDYLEDPDGDGLTDPGENSFANPALSLATLLTYTRGSPPKRINPAAIAHDIDTPNFAGGELTVWTIVFATENDRLGIHHEGTGALQIGVANDTISFGGVTIGTFSGGTADTPLIIHFNANASSAAVQALVRNVGGKLDLASFKLEPASTLELNDIGNAQLRLAAPLPLENYLHHRRTGAFLVIDPLDGNTLAAGLVKDHPGDHEDERYSI